MIGGVAYGKLSSDIIDGSRTRIGWTAGAGVEYAIDDTWSVKGEYAYIRLNKWEVSYGDAKVDFHTVRA